jgi:nucleotide-binding universal stress UspA family protein
MIAWDGRIESARAVRESLDLLVGAKVVELVLVDPIPNEDGHGAEPGADAATYLARHGVRVNVARLPSEGLVTASVLRRHAIDCAANLIVMGGYGHSRLRERLFGGVTKSMIDEPPVAVFMAH